LHAEPKDVDVYRHVPGVGHEDGEASARPFGDDVGLHRPVVAAIARLCRVGGAAGVVAAGAVETRLIGAARLEDVAVAVEDALQVGAAERAAAAAHADAHGDASAIAVGDRVGGPARSTGARNRAVPGAVVIDLGIV